MKLILLCLLIVVLTIFPSTLSHSISIETDISDKVQSVLLSGAIQKEDPKIDSSLLNINGHFNEAKKGTRKFPTGMTIYLKSQSSSTELIICEEANKPTELKTGLALLFQQPSQYAKFMEKGFLFKTLTENCKGMLYYTSADSEAIKVLESFVDALLGLHFPLHFKQARDHLAPQTILNLKIKSEGELDVTFAYSNIKFGFLRQGIKWDQLPNKITQNGNNTYAAKFSNNDIPINVSSKKTVGEESVSAVATLHGSGLHQQIKKNLSLQRKGEKVPFGSETDCDIVLVDVLSDQTYVDQDEIRYTGYMKLKRFEVLDIEKPTETSKQYIWMAKMKLSDLKQLSEQNGELTVTYPVHFRYQSPREEAYANSELLLRTRFFSNCGLLSSFEEDTNDNPFYIEKIKEVYGKEYKKIHMTHLIAENGQERTKPAESINVAVPVGNVALKEEVTILTLIISIAGAGVILYFILQNKKVKSE